MHPATIRSTFLLLMTLASPYAAGTAAIADDAPIAAPAAPTAAAKASTLGSAEYAVRWRGGEGGPATLRAVLSLLASDAHRAAVASEPLAIDSYSVEYFAVPSPPPTPPGFRWIGRSRKNLGENKTQRMLKVRGPEAMTTPWACPFSDPEAVADRKSEADISFGGEGGPKRAYSYSCASENEPFPVATTRLGCARMERVEIKIQKPEDWVLGDGKLTVEQWHLPDDVLVIEVSWSIKGNKAEGITEERIAAGQKAFADDVVARLVDGHAHLLTASMTELVGDGATASCR